MIDTLFVANALPDTLKLLVNVNSLNDENKDKRIEKSIKDDRESFIIDKMWDDFNVLIKFV